MTNTAEENPLKLEVLVQGPGQANKDLVIAGFFEYEDGEPELIGGAKQLNDGLKGKVMEIRKERKKFSGKLRETHLFKSPEGTIPGKNVMMVGLGKLEDFTADIATKMGNTALKKANETKFSEVCMAPEIKDAGVKPYDGHRVTIALIKGIMEAYEELKSNDEEITIDKFYLLAGKANEQHARNGLKDGLDAYYKNDK